MSVIETPGWLKWKELLSVALAWSRLRAVSYFSLQSYYIYKHRRNEGVSPRKKIRLQSRATPLGGPTFLYIFARPASMETVGACASAAVLWGGQRPRGGTPLHKPFRYVPPHIRRVNAQLWSENGYRLCLFWSGIGYGFRGSYGRVWTHRFNSKRVRKKEKYANSKLISDAVCVLKGHVWKRVWKWHFSKQGQHLDNRAARLHH